ncbi:MAG: deoxyhypusine synthase family protein, partial [Promethearchaeota archaeon]
MPKNEFKDILKKVNQYKVTEKEDIISLINSLSDTGFNAKRLAIACEIYKEMINDNECVKFFGLAGALVPAGMQRIIHDFIAEGFIDILVTTGANLTHDVA